jgi:hypothetical protein
MKRRGAGRRAPFLGKMAQGLGIAALALGVLVSGAGADQGMEAATVSKDAQFPCIVAPELPGWCKTPVPWPHRDRWPGKVVPLPVLPDPVIDPVPDPRHREPLPLERL